jgi:hypothetical protein
MDTFAIYTSFRSHLDADGKVFKDVQSIKTRFALLPTSPDALTILETWKKTISAFFDTCLIKRSS